MRGWVAGLFARWQGEVPATDLEAFRASGSGVGDVLLDAERRREQLVLDGRTAWTAPAGAQSELLAAWCADALHTLGKAFLEAADKADPLTPGHVPELVFAQTLACFQRAELWVVRAREAAANPDYRIPVPLPDDLLAVTHQNPCPPEHLFVLLAGAEALRDKAAVAVAELRGAPTSQRHRVDRVRQLLEGAVATTELARRLLGAREPSIFLRAYIEERSQSAAAEYYRIGQLAAVPVLIDRPHDGTGRPVDRPEGAGRHRDEDPARGRAFALPTHAQARGLAAVWMDRDHPSAPLSRLFHTAEITREGARSVRRDLRRLQALPASGSRGRPATFLWQLAQLDRYCDTYGPRGPVQGWDRLRVDTTRLDPRLDSDTRGTPAEGVPPSGASVSRPAGLCCVHRASGSLTTEDGWERAADARTLPTPRVEPKPSWVGRRQGSSPVHARGGLTIVPDRGRPRQDIE